MSLINNAGFSGPSTQYELNFNEGFEVADELLNFKPDTLKLRNDEKYCGFDNNVGESWIYPTNYPMRKYQFEITRVALFKNTLVVLPTGLGKTFLAAVVMYNFYRWYPRGKVIFMAPTRPLVAQQIEACYQIMGIAKCDTLELTGKQQKQKRLAGWKSHRVFFVTPQVLAIDLNENDFPINDIKLIVVDEAHKAKGKYAYTEVVKMISQQNRYFRVLALSATPGRQLQDVAEIVRNLAISHIEVRSESSTDVMPYTHKKNIQTIVVRLNESIREIRQNLMEIISPYVESLLTEKVIQGTLLSLNKGWLVMQQKTFISNSQQQRHPQHSLIMGNFAVCISLYHSLELLERHGVRIFLNFFDNCDDKYYLTRDADLMSFLYKIRETIDTNPLDTSNNNVSCSKDLDFGHPKYEILKKHLIKHFQQNSDTKAMIFCEFRESVQLVYRLLRHLEPLIRSQVFIGQGVGSKNNNTSINNGSNTSKVLITQKKQIETMNSFRQGVINVLIATCVAEEGIDVGEIDLIVCFDISTKNPIRLVQRIGRTGRRRDGKVIMLVTEGKEQTILKDVMASKDSTNRKISECQEIRNEFYNSPRMVPTEFDPKCIETYIKIDGVVPLVKENELNNDDDVNCSPGKSENTLNRKRKNGKNLKKNNKLRDVRQYFKPISKERENVVQELGNVSVSSIDYNTIQDMTSENIDNVVKNITEIESTETASKYEQVLNKLKQSICETHKTYLPQSSTVINSCKDFFHEHSELYSNLISTTKFDGVFDNLTCCPTDELNMTDKCIDEDEYEDEQIDKVTVDTSNIVDIKNPLTQAPQFIELDSKYKSQWTMDEQNYTSPVRKCTNEIVQTHFTSTPIIPQITRFDEIKLENQLKKPNRIPTTKIETPIKKINLLSIKDKVIENHKQKTKEKYDIKDVLSYFRLSSIWELFVPTRPRSTNNLTINLDKLNKSLRRNSINNDKIKKGEKSSSNDEQLFIAASPQKTNRITTKLHRKKTAPIDTNSIKVAILTNTPKNNQKQIAIPIQPDEQCNISNLFNDSFSTDVIVNKMNICDSNNQKPTTSNDVQKTVSKLLINKNIDTSKTKLIDVGHLEDIFCDINADDDIFELDNISVNKTKSCIESAIPANRQTSKDLFDITVKSSDELSSSLKENDAPCHLSQNIENDKVQMITTNNLNINSPNGIEKKSPSAINRRLNFSRLKTERLKQINSMPVTLSAKKSFPPPIFQVNTEVVSFKNPSTSEHNNTKQIQNKTVDTKRLNFQDFQYQPSRISDESSFFTKRNKKPFLKLNYSDDNDDKTDDNVNVSNFKPQNRTNISNSSSSDDDFETSINKSFKILPPSSSSPSPSPPAQKSTKHYKSKKRKKNPYLLNECNVSDADDISSDESDGPTQFIKWDSICVTDDDEITQNSQIDMQAKYLQSIKSPIRKPIRGFRIPEIKMFPHSSHENDSFVEDDYEEEDSFVVHNECDNENVTNNTLCPLEKAEQILKERKREAKRKRRGIEEIVVSSPEDDNKIDDKRKRKRRKILPTILSSDEDLP